MPKFDGALDTVRYVLGLFLVVGLPPGVVWWFFVHPFVGFWRRLGARVTMGVMTVFMLVGVVALFRMRGAIMGADLGTSAPLLLVGAVFVAGGFFITVKRKKHLTNRILAGVPEVHADEDKRGELLDQGPYALVRHPRYMEVVFITFGYAAISNHVGPWVLLALALPVGHLLVLLEERELLDRFGDAYREYCARVPRYVPRLGG